MENVLVLPVPDCGPAHPFHTVLNLAGFGMPCTHPKKGNSHVFPSGADIFIASDACPRVTHLLIEGAASGDQSNLRRHFMYGCSIQQIPAREALSPALAEEWWGQGLGFTVLESQPNETHQLKWGLFHPTCLHAASMSRAVMLFSMGCSHVFV